MDVDPPQTSTIEPFRFDEAKYLEMVCDDHLRQCLEQGQNLSALRERPTSELSDHKGMRQDFSIEKELTEPGMPTTEVVDPDRGVGQYHAAPGRRRGIGRNLF